MKKGRNFFHSKVISYHFNWRRREKEYKARDTSLYSQIKQVLLDLLCYTRTYINYKYSLVLCPGGGKNTKHQIKKNIHQAFFGKTQKGKCLAYNNVLFSQYSFCFCAFSCGKCLVLMESRGSLWTKFVFLCVLGNTTTLKIYYKHR